MSNLQFFLHYRPIRLGWCIRENNFDDLRQALKLTYTLWGGRYNPLIPIGTESRFADTLSRTCQVDMFYALSDDNNIAAFIDRQKFLKWPILHKELFVQSDGHSLPTLLEIYHPILQIKELDLSKRQPISPAILAWKDNDPCKDALLASFGQYPEAANIGIDYITFLREQLQAATIDLDTDQPIPSDINRYFLPSNISSYGLLAWRPNKPEAGFYLGKSSNFWDIVYFWNLRASGTEALFIDIDYPNRFADFRDSYILKNREKVDKQSVDVTAGRIQIWHRLPSNEIDFEQFTCPIIRSQVSEIDWNGLNLTVPLMYCGGNYASGIVTQQKDDSYVTLQMPDKPFTFGSHTLFENFIVSVRPISGNLGVNEAATFEYPYIPELNPFFGYTIFSDALSARASSEGLGYVTNINSKYITLYALHQEQLIEEVFSTFGIRSEPSSAGLVGKRLIQQLGGLQGCRVLKISGVRELISKYAPDKHFTHSGALQTIRQVDPTTEKARFENFERLFIESRKGSKLRPIDAFNYLAIRGLFRPGLKLECPSCRLTFWLSIEDVRTNSLCEYCGATFNIIPQLKDRDWAYRRSGLFGRNDHQAGGIPVAITLQQLHTVLSEHLIAFTTGLNLSSQSVNIPKCETDFTCLVKTHNSKVQLIIGECKTHDTITDDDVDNLSAVAELFEDSSIQPFIIFAKLSNFTPDELSKIHRAQGQYRDRLILLSDRELEPYFIFERTNKELNINLYPTNLESLARATHDIWFRPHGIQE